MNNERLNTLSTEPTPFFALYNRYADYIPIYDALYFQNSATPQYYGYTSQFTQVMVKTEKDIRRFGLPPAVATAYAATVRAALLQSTTMHGGNYAFWTFNAFSFSTPSHAPSDRIVMGDGILEGYAAIGYGDVAPQPIFAHEYVHQIQFENGYDNDLDPSISAPEQTRYAELMADAP